MQEYIKETISGARISLEIVAKATIIIKQIL